MVLRPLAGAPATAGVGHRGPAARRGAAAGDLARSGPLGGRGLWPGGDRDRIRPLPPPGHRRRRRRPPVGQRRAGPSRAGPAGGHGSGSRSGQDGAPGPGWRWPGDPTSGQSAGREILAVATHLNHIADASGVRQRQLETSPTVAGPGVARRTGGAGGRFEPHPLQPRVPAGRRPPLVDLWRRARPDDPGSTMDPANPRYRDIDWMD